MPACVVNYDDGVSSHYQILLPSDMKQEAGRTLSLSLSHSLFAKEEEEETTRLKKRPRSPLCTYSKSEIAPSRLNSAHAFAREQQPVPRLTLEPSYAK